MHIFAIDWGKDFVKRSAYKADLDTRSIARVDFDGSLQHIVRLATSLEGPVLICIDAAIGFPVAAWNRLIDHLPESPNTFVDFLLGNQLPDNFFEAVGTPEAWSPASPFIKPPAGRWSKTAFEEASRNGFYRQIDRQLKANPIFITSGLPGSVGSGTRALWQELISLGSDTEFQVWPFDGPMESLLRSGSVTIAEIYPKACYGIALADALPAPLAGIAKTREPARVDAVDRLQNAGWVSRESIALHDIDAAEASEDDFDAMISAAALLRLVIENRSLESVSVENGFAEGGVLGAANIVLTETKQFKAPRLSNRKKPERQPTSSAQDYPCPIPGCQHVFYNTRGGWDAHVASLKRHPEWHPEISDERERKLRFKREFPAWFI